MPAYHSKLQGTSVGDACGCAILPLRTNLRGPAPILPKGDQEDIIDETLFYFRANIMFRNFAVESNADRTLIYLTFYAQQCLREMEKTDDKQAANRALNLLANKTFAAPGEAGWQLGTIFPAPRVRDEAEMFKAYFKQCREELGTRLIERVFADGTKSKWWQFFSKRRFMGKEMQ
ncbi:actin-related protein 2/3 complex subunit 3 [Tribonema minus]|uniref:Actin-related protein 2/3 complex subunit 3 n=1 Tax=Tribonema minus TaxID=303371 RepID=A0A835YQX6_9STRA|nr:actin-related protein 2/3 complex subunit 3 [Tribonema minus]